MVDFVLSLIEENERLGDVDDEVSRAFTEDGDVPRATVKGDTAPIAEG